jgi:hypothetical protein
MENLIKVGKFVSISNSGKWKAEICTKSVPFSNNQNLVKSGIAETYH